jgi:phage FluMu protein Com
MMVDYHDITDDGRRGKVCGIHYEWWLESAEGAGFMLYPEPEQSKELVADAKHVIRHTRDAVTILVNRRRVRCTKCEKELSERHFSWETDTCDDCKILEVDKDPVKPMTEGEWVS